MYLSSALSVSVLLAPASGSLVCSVAMEEAREALRELAAGGLRGSAALAWELFERAWPALMRELVHLFRALGVPLSLRDDCGQTVLIRVWKGRASFRGGSLGELRAWMRTITSRELARILDVEGRRPRTESELGETGADASGVTRTEEGREQGVETAVEARDDLRALEECIGRLDGLLRAVVELLYSDDAPTERDAAVLLDCSKSQVNVLRQKALRMLAVCMEDKVVPRSDRGGVTHG